MRCLKIIKTGFIIFQNDTYTCQPAVHTLFISPPLYFLMSENSGQVSLKFAPKWAKMVLMLKKLMGIVQLTVPTSLTDMTISKNWEHELSDVCPGKFHQQKCWNSLAAQSSECECQIDCQSFMMKWAFPLSHI